MYYTTKSASKLTGATIRQLQYWRLKEVVVPTIKATGTGHTVYYSRADLFKIKIVLSVLNRGFNFKVASSVVQTVILAREIQVTGQVMFLLETGTTSGCLAVFNLEAAITKFLLEETVILLDLDQIQLELEQAINLPVP